MRKINYILPALLLSVVLTGCTSATSEIRQAAPVMNASGAADYAMKSTENAAEDYDEANYETEDYEVQELTQTSKKSGNGEKDAEKEQEKSQDKLIYESFITMQTLNYPETVKTIKKKVEKYKGFIENENESNNDTYWYYADRKKTSGIMRMSLTLRIPTEHYKEFLDSLEGDGKILSRSANVINVSREYHDTETIIKNLKKQEKRLNEMTDQAETISDMLEIEERLTEVQTELDTYNTRLASLDRDVDYSTVTLTIEEVVQYTPDPEKTETFKERLMNTLRHSAENFLDFAEELLFAIIYALPVIALLAVVVTVIVAIIKGIVRCAKGKKKKKKKEKDGITEESNTVNREDSVTENPEDETKKKD